MKKYLFVDFHNGHETTYHPFLSDIELTNEKATELQKLHCRGAERTGTSIQDIFSIIVDENHCVDAYIHPIYGNKVFQICNPNLSEWTVIEGISGNY